MNSMNTWQLYKILEVPCGASAEDVKESYRRLVKKYHPDMTKDVSSGRRFAEIVQAYKVLSVRTKPRSLVDFPVKNVKKKPASPPRRKKTDIFSLGKLLESGKTDGMRIFAARSLGYSGKKTAYAYLRKALYDPSSLVVKTAVEAIGTLRIRQSAGELASVYSRGDYEIKETVLKTIARIGAYEPFKPIIVLAMNEQERNLRTLGHSLSAEAKKACTG
jgi:hypothetical protein